MSRKQQVRLHLGHGLHRLEAVGALGGDLDVLVRRQHLAQDAARQRLVVDDGDAERRWQAAGLHAVVTAGMRTSTRK